MKRFSELTDEEVCELTNEQLNTSVRIEAIERGIAPPIPLPEALKRSEWKGFQVPAECIEVWRFSSSFHRSNFAYLSKERAIEAMEGLVWVEERYQSPPLIKEEHVTIDCVRIGVTPSTSKAVIFEEAQTDASEEFIDASEEFTAVSDECLQRYSACIQAAYDKRVNAAKAEEYMRLANGNEDVAKAFWSKAEKCEWPGN